MAENENDEFVPFKLDNGNWTYKNTKTNNRCKKNFDDVRSISEGWGAVKIDGKWTYFNPSTGKTCEQRFDEIGWVFEGWGAVKIYDEWTYFNPTTGKLCEQRFDRAFDISEGWGLARNYSGYTFFNPSTGKLCEQRFKDADIKNGLQKGLCLVKVDGGWTFFNPENDFVFSARFPNEEFSLADCLREHPKEFDKLPTAVFRDGELVQGILDEIAEVIKDSAPADGPSQKLEEDTKEIYDMLFTKIEKEKAQIAEEDRAKEMAEKEAARKDEIIEKAVNDIRNLGKNLGGK